MIDWKNLTQDQIDHAICTARIYVEQTYDDQEFVEKIISEMGWTQEAVNALMEGGTTLTCEIISELSDANDELLHSGAGSEGYPPGKKRALGYVIEQTSLVIDAKAEPVTIESLLALPPGTKCNNRTNPRSRRDGVVTVFKPMGDLLRDVNLLARWNLRAWVPQLFGMDAVLRSSEESGYRISSEALGRDLEEDISIHPWGIVDFGVHDMGDPTEGRRTPIELVLEWRELYHPTLNSGSEPTTPDQAARWLCERLGIIHGTFTNALAQWKRSDPAWRQAMRQAEINSWIEPPSGGADNNDGGTDNSTDNNDGGNEKKRRKTVKEFCSAYKPARRIVGNFIEAGYVYFLTAPAFAGKTQFATTLMYAIAAKLDNLLNIEVREGRVAYLALENPDDTRKRIIGQRYHYSLNHDELATKITIIDEFTRRNAKGEPVSPLINAGVELRQDCEENGPLSIVFIDSYQAAFAGNNFNDNSDMLETMRLCRDLTKLPGNPAVIVLAHPVKNVSEDNLVPYGGGSAINEGDGNLTLWQDTQTKIIKFHWLRKLRGTPFDPKLFAIKTRLCPDLLDEEGRQCEVPIIEPITSDAEPEDRQEKARHRQKAVPWRCAKEQDVLSISQRKQDWCERPCPGLFNSSKSR